MTKLRNNDGSPLHRAVPELAERVRRGAIDRRSFLRTVSLLGVSVASAKAFLAGTEGGLGFSPRPALAQEPKRGGTFRMAMQTQEITDPANYNWIEASDITRNIIEYPDPRRRAECHPSLPRRELDPVGRPEGLVVQAAAEREVVERRRFHDRGRRVQLQALAQPELEVGQPHAVRRHRVREDRAARLQAPPAEAEAVDPGGALRLHLLDRAPRVRRAGCELPEEPDRHRPLQPGRVRHRQDREGEAARRLLGQGALPRRDPVHRSRHRHLGPPRGARRRPGRRGLPGHGQRARPRQAAAERPARQRAVGHDRLPAHAGRPEAVRRHPRPQGDRAGRRQPEDARPGVARPRSPRRELPRRVDPARVFPAAAGQARRRAGQAAGPGVRRRPASSTSRSWSATRRAASSRMPPRSWRRTSPRSAST